MIVRSAIDDAFPGLRYDYEQPIGQQTPDDGWTLDAMKVKTFAACTTTGSTGLKQMQPK